MVRNYGKIPYKVAVIHGGPGDLGSLACVAKELSTNIGVLEPIQSKYTLQELIDELAEQLLNYIQEPISLIGHSFGAWLSILLNEQYPELVSQLILVNSGPFEVDYVGKIAERRMENLSRPEQTRFQEVLTLLEKKDLKRDTCLKKDSDFKKDSYLEEDSLIDELEKFVDKTDNFFILKEEEQPRTLPLDSTMYTSIWKEVEQLRKENGLLNSLSKITCPVYVIHGMYDPHPIEGVIRPLKKKKIPFKVYRLDKCGHSPFKECFAKEEFYKILFTLLCEK